MAQEEAKALLDRIRGGLLGLAAGDALGASVEFMSRDAIRRQYGRVTEMVGGGPYGLAPGEGTDKTGMALAVAEGLAQQAEGEDPREAVGRRLLAWFESGPKLVGSTVRTALTSYQSSRDWDAAVARTRVRLRDMAGDNGSLVRTLPVSFAYLREPERMVQVASRLSEMTHPHELPTLACVFYNELARRLALGDSRDEALAAAQDVVAGRGPLVAESSRQTFLRQLERLRTLGYGQVRASGFALDALVGGLWIFLQARDLEGALADAVGLGENADALGAIVGGLAGTFWGAAALPSRWLERLQAREALEAAARRLYERGEGVAAGPA